MQQHSISVEQGLQRLSDTVIACARRMPRSRNTSGASRRPGQGAPWFDAECGSCCEHFKVSWAAHLASPQDEQLHVTALNARKAYKRLLSRKKYAFKQQLQVQHLQALISACSRASSGRPFWVNGTRLARSQMLMNGLIGSAISWGPL